MKVRIFILLLFLVLISCKRETKITQSEWIHLSKRTKFTENAGNLMLETGKFKYSFDEKHLPFKKIIVLNASMMGYISELNVENKMVGISSPEYVYSPKIQNLVQTGEIQNVGSDQKYDVEKILSLQPEAVFTNHIPSFENTYDILVKNGIKVIFLDEYLEQKPLEKASYIKIFGKLLGKEELANQKFKEIELHYNNLKKLAFTTQSKPNVLANEMYGNIWYMPGGKTSVAQFISDANANYILKDNKEDKSVTMSFEEVFAKAVDIQVWVNAGNHLTKNEMLKMNAFYGKLDVFTEGKVYAFSKKQTATANDFFESGLVRCDLVLKDYIKIFHPELFPEYRLTYFKELP